MSGKQQKAIVEWLQSSAGQNELSNTVERIRQVNVALQKAREIDRKELVEPITL